MLWLTFLLHHIDICVDFNNWTCHSCFPLWLVFHAKVVGAGLADVVYRPVRVFDVAVFVSVPDAALAAAFHADSGERSVDVALVAIQKLGYLLLLGGDTHVSEAFHEGLGLALRCGQLVHAFPHCSV